jgi:hypothetical protein
MSESQVAFFQGISTAGSFVVALIFLRFWRESHDRLFAFFGAAFATLAVSWTLLGLTSPEDETRPYLYAIRLVAFLLLIAGIVDKNRGTQ